MEKINVFGYVIMGFIAYMSLKIYQESDVFNLKCIVSTVDGNKYCVRERANLEAAADLLAQTTYKCRKLVVHMAKKHPDNEDLRLEWMQTDDPMSARAG